METDAEDVPIRVKGLRTAFGDKVIHEDLGLEVKRGEILGVVGGSGSGKSVLLNTILGLKQPDGGSVDAGAARADVALVPVGSFEQHGPNGTFELDRDARTVLASCWLSGCTLERCWRRLSRWVFRITI